MLSWSGEIADLLGRSAAIELLEGPADDLPVTAPLADGSHRCRELPKAITELGGCPSSRPVSSQGR